MLKGTEDEKKEKTLLMQEGAVRHSWDRPGCSVDEGKGLRSAKCARPGIPISLSLSRRRAPMTSASPLPVDAQRSRGSKRRSRTSSSVRGPPDLDLSTPFTPPPMRPFTRFIYFHLQRRCLRQFNFQLPKYRDAFGPTPRPFLECLALSSFRREGGVCAYHFILYIESFPRE